MPLDHIPDQLYNYLERNLNEKADSFFKLAPLLSEDNLKELQKLLDMQDEVLKKPMIQSYLDEVEISNVDKLLFDIKETKGDGHCLFHALITALDDGADVDRKISEWRGFIAKNIPHNHIYEDDELAPLLEYANDEKEKRRYLEYYLVKGVPRIPNRIYHRYFDHIHQGKYVEYMNLPVVIGDTPFDCKTTINLVSTLPGSIKLKHDVYWGNNIFMHTLLGAFTDEVPQESFAEIQGFLVFNKDYDNFTCVTLDEEKAPEEGKKWIVLHLYNNHYQPMRLKNQQKYLYSGKELKEKLKEYERRSSCLFPK